jgi:hypothetical protein
MVKNDVDDPWADLVVSVLSVNNRSLENIYTHIDTLRKQGLFQPKNLSTWNLETLVARLKAGGYDRGAFMTNLFALRLANLGQHVQQVGLDACSKIIAGGDVKAIERLLLPVNGIGPAVIRNFCFLRNIPGL